MMQHMYKLVLTLQRWVDDFHFPQNYIKKSHTVENCQLKKTVVNFNNERVMILH